MKKLEPYYNSMFNILFYIVTALFFTFQEICEIGRIRKLQKRFREKK